MRRAKVGPVRCVHHRLHTLRIAAEHRQRRSEHFGEIAGCCCVAQGDLDGAANAWDLDVNENDGNVAIPREQSLEGPVRRKLTCPQPEAQPDEQKQHPRYGAATDAYKSPPAHAQTS